MKKNVIKTAFAAVCVVAAGMGGMKAYNTANQSEADLLLAENVEALTAGDENHGAHEQCKIPVNAQACWKLDDPKNFQGMTWKSTILVNNYGQCVCVADSRSCPEGSATRQK